MSEQWPEFDSEQPNVESEPPGSSSANGANPEHGVGVADGSAEDSVPTDGQTADEMTAAAELGGEDSVSAVADGAAPESGAADDGAAPAEPLAADADASTAVGADDGAAAAVPADEGSVFLAQLVRAMQTTAGLERARIGEDTERRRQAYIDKVRARETSEADRMRELADEDMKTIEAWADGETKRIQLERERRATELHQDLDLSLAEHRAKIDREIEGLEASIAIYQADVVAFFEGLDRETDLTLIAQQAAKRPVFPTLEVVAETVVATSAAPAETEPASPEEPPAGPDDSGTGAEIAGATEPEVVGVMDTQAPAEPVESWVSPPDTSPEPGSAEASDDVVESGEAGEPAEPVTASAGPNQGSASSLFKSVPVLRPMSWLRDAIGGDPSSREG
jgi:hypothetical protein